MEGIFSVLESEWMHHAEDGRRGDARSDVLCCIEALGSCRHLRPAPGCRSLEAYEQPERHYVASNRLTVREIGARIEFAL